MNRIIIKAVAIIKAVTKVSLVARYRNALDEIARELIIGRIIIDSDRAFTSNRRNNVRG